jgi:hypothetical protein
VPIIPLPPGPVASVIVLAALGTASTIPATVVNPADADIMYGIDISPIIGAGSLSAVTAKLVDLSVRGQPTVTLDAEASFTGLIVTQEIPEGILRSKHFYRLEMAYTISGTSDVFVSGLGIKCPW